MTTLERLTLLRRELAEAGRLAQTLSAMQPSPPPVRLDGMPRARGGASDGVDRLIDARDMLARRIAEKRERAGALAADAAAFLNTLGAELYAFAVEYYLSAAPVAVVAEHLDVSVSTAYDRLRKIKAAAARYDGLCPHPLPNSGSGVEA